MPRRARGGQGHERERSAERERRARGARAFALFDIIASRSSSTPESLMPCFAKSCWASWKRCDECSSALDGMQPTLRQVPPSEPRDSTHAFARATRFLDSDTVRRGAPARSRDARERGALCFGASEREREREGGRRARSHRLEAELRRLDGRDVAARPAADDHHVVFFARGRGRAEAAREGRLRRQPAQAATCEHRRARSRQMGGPPRIRA